MLITSNVVWCFGVEILGRMKLHVGKKNVSVDLYKAFD